MSAAPNSPRLLQWQVSSLALAVVSGVVSIVMAIVLHERLGPWQWVFHAAGALALLAALRFRRVVSQTEHDLVRREGELRERAESLSAEAGDLREARSAFEQEFAAESQRLMARQQAFSRRLTTFHEWQEFPAPIDLNDPAAPREEGSQLAELVRKDQQLQALLQAETEALFHRVRRNEYVVNGQFQLPKLRDDFFHLMLASARIYKPDVENPLLETSIERALRAVARLALQWQVALESLPLDLKTRNIGSIYGYIRQGVQAYQTYQAVRPYWSYVNNAWYLGRLALGANPLALGAWWLFGRLGTRSAQALAERILHQQALTLLADLVRVVGYEVADMYGGDFRHRDPNWIYAAELTDLVARFPLSRDSLREALREISTLTLRSEYDRSFLVRCLTLGRSARPGRNPAEKLLTVTERRNIARRLEKFLARHVHGKTPARLDAWAREAEGRLGLKITLDGASFAASFHQQIRSALLSLAGYLSSVKQLEGPVVRSFLHASGCWKQLPPALQDDLSRQLDREIPMFFEEPDVEPQGEAVQHYFADLVRAAARFPPRAAMGWDLIRDVAHYLGHPVEKVSAQWQQELGLALRDSGTRIALPRPLEAEVVATLLDLLDGEVLVCFYRGVTFEPWPEAAAPAYLLGTATQLLAFAVESTGPKLRWQARSAITCELQRSLMTRDCLVVGGEWLSGGTAPRLLRVAGPLLQSSETYFQPLLGWKVRATPALPAPAN